MISTAQLIAALAAHPRVVLGHHPTPIDYPANLCQDLGIELLIKRDDCNGLAFGGNKVRQLEYYLGPAIETGADTILVTGAVQSNFVRTTAAAAAKLGLKAEVQLEDRVAGRDGLYDRSGNVLLDEMLGARIDLFPEGENEAGADHALDSRAAELAANGRKPYVIHLGMDHPPTGGLGYAAAVAEVLSQLGDRLPDAVFIPSGSGLTHAGFLVGARACGWQVPIIGVCVRRSAELQADRIQKRASQIASLLGFDDLIKDADVIVRDDVLAPGYGTLNDAVANAIDVAARREALLLDPVYSGRTLAGLIEGLAAGIVQPGARVLMIHTGGNTSIFAYHNKLAEVIDRITPIGLSSHNSAPEGAG